MHGTLHNELRLEWSILPITPLLISAGEGRFVRSAHPDTSQPTAYLPGGALKGMIRAASEGMIHSTDTFCCRPGAPCHAIPDLQNARDAVTLYRGLCPACKLFGSKLMRSRLTIEDSYPLKALDDLLMHTLNDSEVCEAINGEPFEGTLIVRNFERWQIGLLGSVLAQINAGHITLGANRSAGMGRVLIRFTAAALTYFGFYSEETWGQLGDRIHGVGQLAGRSHGFVYPDLASERDLPAGGQYDSGFGFARVVYAGDDARQIHPLIEQMLFRQLPAWEQYIAALSAQPRRTAESSS